MRYYPTDSDAKEVANLNAAPWMIEALRMNPSYTCWGPYEDYMMSDKGGWASPVVCKTWDDFSFGLDDLNEVVHFYFDVERSSIRCPCCDGDGLNAASHEISEDWYDFARRGTRWCNRITQDEVDALWAAGRLKHDFEGKPTAAQVNLWESGKGLGHDAINRWICVETRCRRLGVWGECEDCGGDGFIFTEPAAKLGLVLWVLHPRKGASRGVHVAEIKQPELPDVCAYLRQAARRNAERFSRIAAQKGGN